MSVHSKKDFSAISSQRWALTGKIYWDYLRLRMDNTSMDNIWIVHG